MNRRLQSVFLRVALAALLSAPCVPFAIRPVEAAFPGVNGKIAYIDHDHGYSRIFVMNADGSDPTPVSTPPDGSPGLGDFDPVWSPDGTKIAFDASDDGNSDIFVMNADGSGRTNLTHAPGSDSEPSWSPDGTKIVFVSNHGTSQYELYVMNADGSGQVRLTFNGNLNTNPAWSPDGTKIAFVHPTGPALVGGDVFIINADGTGQTNLTNDNAYNQYPDWSPDGSKLAFVCLHNGVWQIRAMNSDGSSPTPLLESGVTCGFPCWSPDGTKILFDIVGNGVWVMNSDGSDTTRLVNGSEPNWQRLQPAAPNITCSPDIFSATDAGECSAVIEYDVVSSGIPAPTVTCSPGSGSAFPVGTTTVTCTATNGVAPDATCSFAVTVTDDEPPTIANASATPSVLSTPNHRMIDVTVSYDAADNCSGATACSLSVSSNEPENGLGDGDVAPDWKVLDAHHVRLRSERSGTGTGRVYTITIACTDAAGNSSTASVNVTVPH